MQEKLLRLSPIKKESGSMDFRSLIPQRFRTARNDKKVRLSITLNEVFKDSEIKSFQQKIQEAMGRVCGDYMLENPDGGKIDGAINAGESGFERIGSKTRLDFDYHLVGIHHSSSEAMILEILKARMTPDIIRLAHAELGDGGWKPSIAIDYVELPMTDKMTPKDPLGAAKIK